MAEERGLGEQLAKARETRAANLKTKKAAPVKKTVPARKDAPANTAKVKTL